MFTESIRHNAIAASLIGILFCNCNTKACNLQFKVPIHFFLSIDMIQHLNDFSLLNQH